MGFRAPTSELRMAEIIFTISMFTRITGTALRPVVTFTPTWNKILHGDSVVMTCDGDAAVQGNVTYTRYRNNEWTHTGKMFTIPSAQSRHGGNYQCSIGEENISEGITLYVTPGPVILQSPPYIYEGDDLSLRCHSGSRAFRGPVVFYKNNEMISSSTANSEILIGNHKDASAVYNCTKEVFTTDYGVHSDEINYTVQGAAASVMVTFSPNWRNIFSGESITMSCEGNLYKPYSWYKDGRLLEKTDQNYMKIICAQRSDSGSYYCGTSSTLSPPAHLDVSDGAVILQAPLYVYDRYKMYLRCRSRSEYSVEWTKFYKDGEFLQDSEDGRLMIRQPDAAARYRCEKGLYGNYVPHTESVSVPIRELFSRPEIRLTPSTVRTGDNMTLTCETRLSPHRPTTELQFTFYRDGREVQRLSSSNNYEFTAVQLEDSGNYTCEVRTLDNRVWKRSQQLHVQIFDGNQKYRNFAQINTIRLIMSGLIVIIGFIILCHHLKSEVGRSEDVNREEDGTELENIARQPL
ncbi:Fc receptor-like protein 5 [Eleutherodactylus coqui]|uniref:Fc receptor-like protein 5 n=1 Tax=Eleutherodactylus coqui TaxID=57060 RepID=UPI003461CA1D